jgi:DNA-binding CsgD family transcriptional regulator
MSSNAGPGPKEDEENDEASDAGADTSPSGVFPVGRAKKKDGWTVTEQFVSKGFHYCVLRRPVGGPGDRPQLTKREGAAVALAAEGHSNKAIAAELEVSPSTVGVLLFRAAQKLSAKSRAELAAAYRRLQNE